ncbi:MAG: leucine-rich repeat domain-containing protein, partial [Dehalococcoidia bacterium]|nr:leucine-rich repeat domain-containing protein [Dehalococcoidia bacterium]
MAAAAGCAYGIPGLLALIFVVMREAEFGPERARAAPRGDDGDKIGMERRPAGTRMSKRKLAGIIVVCAIVAGFITAVAIPLATKDDREITFADPNLEAVVRQAIDIPEGPIYAWAVGGRTSLAAHGMNITDLGGLENFASMRALVLVESQISDLSPLAGLTKLQSLYLWENRITDISSLAALTGLTSLGLGDNQISDISPLANLTGLTSLGLGDNQISDISPLAGLTSLEWLWLNDNQISDMSPLVDNTGLGEGATVHLQHNPLNEDSVNIHIPSLVARGVTVEY